MHSISEIAQSYATRAYITMYKLHFEFAKVSRAVARASHLRTPKQFKFHAIYLNMHVITPRYELMRMELANFSAVNTNRRNMWVNDITRNRNLSKSPSGYDIIEYSRLRRHITMETVGRILF